MLWPLLSSIIICILYVVKLGQVLGPVSFWNHRDLLHSLTQDRDQGDCQKPQVWFCTCVSADGSWMVGGGCRGGSVTIVS